MTALSVLKTAACTSVGLSPAAAAAAVRCALSGFSEYANAQDGLGEPAIVAAPPGIAGIGDPVEAIGAMAVAALSQIADGDRLPVLLALPETRPGLPADLGAQIAAVVKAQVPGVQVALADGAGHAAGGAALRQARDYLAQNPGSVVAVVGADSYLHFDTIRWLDWNRQLHAPYNAWGFIPGAAAGACLLAHPPRAEGRGPPRAIVEKIAVDREDVPIKTDGVCLGWAMTRIVETLLDDQPLGAVFDGFYCDQNGETYRADEMGFMLARTNERFSDPAAFVAPADCWGDVGAASLPLFIALAVEAADRGYARGPVSVHLAGSESGLRAGFRLRTRVGDA
jgi:3-oxoacyl-[acyl-carrier-protein] synthase-1